MKDEYRVVGYFRAATKEQLEEGSDRGDTPGLRENEKEVQEPCQWQQDQ